MSFEKLRKNLRVFRTMLHVSHGKSSSGETRWLDGKMEAEIKGNLAFVPLQNQRRTRMRSRRYWTIMRFCKSLSKCESERRGLKGQ